ncbi:MAG TPA: GNAT family N-acetyltransferase [Acidimicrobiales bacterium]|nr:GNAT family N-acetyltransferase [Acidimicrobiales bacterium]
MDAPPLRLATADDVDELVRLRRVMMGALEVCDEPTWALACADFLRRTLADGSAAAVVAGDPGAVPSGSAAADRHRPEPLVACGIGVIVERVPGPETPTGRYGYVCSMVTEPDWRGRGLATGVVEGLLAWFADRGVRKVDLHASDEGEPIYRRFGFREGRFPELRWRAPASGL